MSYILDALNKADSERERKRSAVPGLQAQSDYVSDRDRGGLPWRTIAIGSAVLLAAVVAWLVLGRDEPPPPPPAVAMPAPVVAPMPVSPAPVAPLQASPAPPMSVQSSPAPVTTPAPAAPVVAAAPTALPSPPAPAPAPAARVAKPVAAAPAVKQAAAAASAPARVPSRSELPAELRAALPPINISGAVHAPAARDRLLFVNGGVLREGDAIAEGLTIERIGASSSVLVFRGTRFEIRH